MTKYRVTIEETRVYEIEVETDGPSQAERLAKKQFEAEHPDHHDYDVADVERLVHELKEREQ